MLKRPENYNYVEEVRQKRNYDRRIQYKDKTWKQQGESVIKKKSEYLCLLSTDGLI